MRWFIPIVIFSSLAFLGCEHGEGGAVVCLHEGEAKFPGDFFPAGDGCNFCTCESNGDISCSTDSCNGDGGVIIIDAPGSDACFPNGFCPDGVECNGSCCAPGERCDQGFCTCGQKGPCTSGDTCASGGPIGGGSCGTICCGITQPCPL